MQTNNNDDENAKHAEAFRRIMDTMGRRNTFEMRRGRTFPAFMTVAVIAVLGTVLWYSYPKESEYREINSVPLIRADAGPMKAVPNDPGGMEIPYRDSTVFDTIRSARNENGEGGVENLLSDAEEPLSREQMFAGINTALEGETADELIEVGVNEEADAAGEIEAIAAVQVDKGITEATETKEIEVAVATTTTTTTPDAPTPSKKPDDIADSMARTEPAAGGAVIAATGGYLVQLASVKSRENAVSLWKDMQKKFPTELGGLNLNVDVADLGARGTYYRVQGGSVSEERARAICSAIDAQKAGGCLVVRNR